MVDLVFENLLLGADLWDARRPEIYGFFFRRQNSKLLTNQRGNVYSMFMERSDFIFRFA